MKKMWNLVKDVSMPIFGVGYALVWVFNKLANKKDKPARRFEIAELITYVITMVNGIIHLIS